MTQREVRALLLDQRKDSQSLIRGKTRSSAKPSRAMSEDTDRVAELEAKLEEAQQTIDEQATELERAKESGYQLQQRLDEAKSELDAVMLRAEVERLRALEKVREEERERSQAWADDLQERFKAEKTVLEEKIAALEVRSTSKASTSTTSVSPDELPTSVSSVTTPPSSTSTSSVTITTALTSSSSATMAPSTSGSATVTSGTLPSTLSATPPASGTTVSTTAAGTASMASGTGTTVTHSTTTLTSAGSAEMIAKFFETQSQLLAAQVQAASLPPLVCFDGSSENDDSEFLQWLERFEERARLEKWTEETKLCQLKLHLTKLAHQVFQMLAKEEKSSYSLAVVALKKRFRSVEIEELKGLEFHRRVQGEETIEQLGMELQKLGRKAFPTAEGKEFDRLLKGRFYQALHPRWQRKLNAPRTDETFTQLFE